MSKIDLSKYGITGTTEIVHNPSYEMLFEEETKPELEGFEKGQVSELGAVNVMTGVYTGRSPKDKFIVVDENSILESIVAKIDGEAYLVYRQDLNYEYYTNLVGYINYENKDYIKIFSKELNNEYVGSIITLKEYDSDTITYESINYYCSDYKFIGILDKEPDCNIVKTTNNTFKLRKYNNSLKVNDIKDFLDTKKIY